LWQHNFDVPHSGDWEGNLFKFHAGLGEITTFFFHYDADFKEITDFTYATNEQYGLGIKVLQGDFKAGLEELIAGAPIKAIFLGTRRYLSFLISYIVFSVLDSNAGLTLQVCVVHHSAVNRVLLHFQRRPQCQRTRDVLSLK